MDSRSKHIIDDGSCPFHFIDHAGKWLDMVVLGAEGFLRAKHKVAAADVEDGRGNRLLTGRVGLAVDVDGEDVVLALDGDVDPLVEWNLNIAFDLFLPEMEDGPAFGGDGGVVGSGLGPGFEGEIAVPQDH